MEQTSRFDDFSIRTREVAEATFAIPADQYWAVEDHHLRTLCLRLERRDWDFNLADERCLLLHIEISDVYTNSSVDSPYVAESEASSLYSPATVTARAISGLNPGVVYMAETPEEKDTPISDIEMEMEIAAAQVRVSTHTG